MRCCWLTKKSNALEYMESMVKNYFYKRGTAKKNNNLMQLFEDKTYEQHGIINNTDTMHTNFNDLSISK